MTQGSVQGLFLGAFAQSSKVWFVITVQCVRRWCSLVIVLMSVGAIPAQGQTENLQEQLNSTYKGRVWLLRNFYSGSDLEYDPNGILLSATSSGPWTLAYVQITGVTVSTQGIEVVGNRLGALFNGEKPRFTIVGKLRIHVARPATNIDTESALQPTFSKILIGPDEDLRPLLPDHWKYYLTGTDTETRSAAWAATLDKSTLPQKERATIPKAVHSPDPSYTKEAKSHGIDGQTLLGIVVDSSGAAVHIAILEPLGMGLDEQAVLALKQWKFRPSTLHGRPVPVRIQINIHFRCCP